MTNQDRLSRFGPLGGALFVVLEMAGVAIGSQPMVALGDPTSKIVSALTKHVGTGAWVGAYLELASLAGFTLFAVWLFRSGRGLLPAAGLVTAGVYVTVTLVALVVGDVVKYGSGHGMGSPAILALFDLQSGLFFASWGLAGAFLALAPATGWLRVSALAIAGLLLVAMAAPTAGPSQLPNMLFLVWTVVASVVLARRPHTVRSPAAAAARA